MILVLELKVKFLHFYCIFSVLGNFDYRRSYTKKTNSSAVCVVEFAGELDKRKSDLFSELIEGSTTAHVLSD